MTDAEKIEALREWLLAERQQNEGVDDWNYGHLVAIDKVLRFIDPPKPKWREMVDAAKSVRHCWLPGNELAATLYHLSELANSPDDSHQLACIVAMCEDKVGDGWQADPACWNGTVTLHTLIDRLSCDEEDDYYTPVGKVTDWQGLGHAAAAWLRSLTDGGAA